MTNTTKKAQGRKDYDITLTKCDQARVYRYHLSLNLPIGFSYPFGTEENLETLAEKCAHEIWASGVLNDSCTNIKVMTRNLSGESAVSDGNLATFYNGLVKKCEGAKAKLFPQYDHYVYGGLGRIVPANCP